MKRERQLESRFGVIQGTVAQYTAQAAEPIADRLGMDLEHLGDR